MTQNAAAPGEPRPGSQDPAFFVPRRWLVSRVGRWLVDDAQSSVLILSGPPGTGKSRFLNGWSKSLSAPGSDAILGAVLLQDLTANRMDDFSWPGLRDHLLALTDARSRPTAPEMSVEARIGSVAAEAEVNIVRVENLVGDLVLGSSDPVREFRNVVLPALAQLPAGPPIVIGVDGLDEAFRYEATDFLKVVGSLANAVAAAQRRDHGVGRIRLLLTSQPEVPITINPLLQPAVIDLSDPDISDREDMRDYVEVLLSSLDEPDRVRLSAMIAEQADGVWVIAFYAAQKIIEEVAAGATPPELVSLPLDLAANYAEAVDRARKRLGKRWPAAQSLLTLVAAAQDATASGLPRDVAVTAMRMRDADLDPLLAGIRGLVSHGHDHVMRFYHGDFGRWVIGRGLSEIGVRDAHDRLAQVLMESGANGWHLAGAYAAHYAGMHALGAAELTVGDITNGRMVQRCISIYSDRSRLDSDPNPVDMLRQLDRLSALCPAATRLASMTEPLEGLSPRLFEELQTRVGLQLSSHLSAAQIEDYERLADAGDQQQAGRLLANAVPEYDDIVADEFRRLVKEILDGQPLPVDNGEGLRSMANDYYSDWQRTGRADSLDVAIALQEDTLACTPAERWQRADRLARLADMLSSRVGTDAEHPEDLDRLIEVQSELVARTDLSRTLGKPGGRPWAVYSFWLSERAKRDKQGRAHDVDRAIAAAEKAHQLTPPDHADRASRLIRLANALISRVGTDGEQPGDLDRCIETQRELVHRDDLPESVSEPGDPWLVLANLLVQRWQRIPSAHLADLDEAFAAAETALTLAPPGHPDRTERLGALADMLNQRLDTDAEQPGDLDRLLEVQRELVCREDAYMVLTDQGQPWRLYAYLLSQRWRRDPAVHSADLDEAISAAETALSLTLSGQVGRAPGLVRLANALIDRVGTDGEQPGDLDRCIETQRELVRRDDLAEVVSDPGDPWAMLAEILVRRWERDRATNLVDLDEAVAAAETALTLAPPGHPGRTERLATLVDTLNQRLDTDTERPADLDRLIGVQRELAQRDDLNVVVDLPEFWLAHSQRLLQCHRRDPANRLADLEEAVGTAENALAHAPAGHPRRTARIATLADTLNQRLDTDTEQPGDLDRLIEVQGELVQRDDLSSVVSEPARSWVLASYLFSRRWRRDSVPHTSDLDEAVEAAETALALASPVWPDRASGLVRLVNALIDRVGTDAEQPGDLDRCIETQRELVNRDDFTDSVGDPGQILMEFADMIVRGLQRDHAAHLAGLDEAIGAAETALALAPPGHSGRGERLATLSDTLNQRFDTKLEQPGDLERLIDVQRELVYRDDLSEVVTEPARSWEFYAYLVRTHRRREEDGRSADVHEAVLAASRTLALTEPDHPLRTGRLSRLADALIERINADSEQVGDLDLLLQTQSELVLRPDLTAQFEDAGLSWSIYGNWLRRRWSRDPDGHADDIGEAVRAFDECVRLTSDDHPDRSRRLVSSANAHLLGYLNGVAQARLSTAREQARQVLRSGDPVAEVLLPAIRYSAH